jgi:hypothetical protein
MSGSARCRIADFRIRDIQISGSAGAEFVT